MGTQELIVEHEQLLSLFFPFFFKKKMIQVSHSRHEINSRRLTAVCKIGQGKKDGLRFICIVGGRKGQYLYL